MKRRFPEAEGFLAFRRMRETGAEGKPTRALPRTIVISIIDFKLFDCAEYYSEFKPLEVTRHDLLSDKMEFHFFELPKLPADFHEDNMLLLWLSLFKANTEEELDRIKALEVFVMDQAIDAYHTITASSEFQERERLYAKARHDEAQALYNNARNNARNIARRMIDAGEPVEKIMLYTELSEEDIARLRNAE